MAVQTIVLHLKPKDRSRLRWWRRRTRQAVVLRRCQILLHADAGETPAQIAGQVGCAVSTVYRTLDAFQRTGLAGVRPKASPGRPRKVSPVAECVLNQALAQPPREWGLNFSNWTGARLRRVLKLKVHPTTVWRMLHRLGWRWRRPKHHVHSPDPRYGAKRRYVQHLRRQAARGEIHLYYADEMDVALLPTLCGCWMRVGQQRTVNTPRQNQTRYVFGAVHAQSGALYWVLCDRKNNVGFRRLLQMLLTAHQADPVPVVIVLDNYRIHKTQAVQTWLRQVKPKLRLYFLPPYAPHLNPIERFWRHCRRNVTHNFFFGSLARLCRALQAFLREMARAPHIVRSIIA